MTDIQNYKNRREFVLCIILHYIENPLIINGEKKSKIFNPNQTNETKQ